VSPDILYVRVRHKGHHYSLAFLLLFYCVNAIQRSKCIPTYISLLFQQLARITKALDPNNTGLINFDQFCDGIAQISSLQGLTLKEVASDLTRRSRENSLVEDSDRRSLVRKKFYFQKKSNKLRITKKIHLFLFYRKRTIDSIFLPYLPGLILYKKR